MEPRTHYDTLGVPHNAPADTIKSAYRALMRTHHPDIAGPSGAAKTRLVNAAMAELGDPDRRRAYDRSIQPEPTYERPQPARQQPRQRPQGEWENPLYRPIDDEVPAAAPLMERPYFKFALATGGVGLLLLLGSTAFFWWRAFYAGLPIESLAGAPLLLVVVTLVGTLAEQGRIWPWVILAAVLFMAPVSVVSLGVAGLLLGGGALRLASQSIRNHWRTRPLPAQ